MSKKLALLATLSGHNGPIYDLCFDKTNNRLFSCSADKKIACWSLDDYANIPPNIGMPHTVFSLAFDAISSRLWLGSAKGNLHVVDLIRKEEIKNFEVHTSPVFNILPVPEENLVIASDGKGILTLWDMKTLEHKSTLPLSEQKIRALYYQQKTGLSIGFINGIREQLSLKTLNTTGKMAVSNYVEPINDMVYLNQLNIWVYALKNGHLIFSNEAKDKALDLPAHNYGIYNVLTLSNEQYVVTGSRDKSIKVWNTNSFTAHQKIDGSTEGHLRSVNSLCKINDDQFCSAGDDGVIKVWGLI